MSFPPNTTIFDLALNHSLANTPALNAILNISFWPPRYNTSFLANIDGTGVGLVNELKSNNFSYLAITLVDSILDQNSSQGLVYCTYPLSGQYDRLPRYLFYGAVIVAVIGVRFTWLAEIAFNVIIAYSSLVAIHLFSLLATYDFNKAYYMGDYLDIPLPEGRETTQGFGDVDVFGILPILWVSVLMLVPMLAWSSTLRSYNARLVIQAWAFCIFIAFFFAFNLWYYYPSTWTEDLGLTAAICKKSDDCLFESNGLQNVEIITWKEEYERCGCIDLCGLMSPKAPMRSGTAMVPLLYPEYLTMFTGPKSKTEAYHALLNAVNILGISALVQGFLALLSSSSSQEAVRNRIFKILYGDLHSTVGFIFKGDRKQAILGRLGIRPARKISPLWRIRRNVARTLATLYYLVESLSLVLYPVAFFMTVFVLEIWTMFFPYSEYDDALGSWGVLAATALALVTYLILLVEPYITRGISALILWVQYDAYDRPEDTGSSMKAEHHYVALDDRVKHLATRVRLCTVWPVVRRWKEFRLWWKDPETFSYPDRVPHGEVDFIAPRCNCSECLNDSIARISTGKISEYVPSKNSNSWSEYAETLLSQERPGDGPDISMR